MKRNWEQWNGMGNGRHLPLQMPEGDIPDGTLLFNFEYKTFLKETKNRRLELRRMGIIGEDQVGEDQIGDGHLHFHLAALPTIVGQGRMGFLHVLNMCLKIITLCDLVRSCSSLHIIIILPF